MERLLEDVLHPAPFHCGREVEDALGAEEEGVEWTQPGALELESSMQQGVG